MKLYLLLVIALTLLLSSCGQNGGNAVSIGSGTSPFPEVKANCNDASCV